MTDTDLESESVTSSTVKVGGTASAAAGIIRREAPGLRSLPPTINGWFCEMVSTNDNTAFVKLPVTTGV
jgi:hypothetical protein